MKCTFMLMFLLVVVSMMSIVNANGHFSSNGCHCQYGGERGGHCHCPWGVTMNGPSRHGGNHMVYFPFGRRKRDLLEQAGRLGKKK
jgi:hypothetical protein